MKKVFISQPMAGRDQDVILRERKVIAFIVTAMLGDDVYFIDSFIQGAKDVNPLFCLGHSLMALSKADLAVFAPDWENSRGCRIERQCCNEYNIRVCEIEHDDLRRSLDDWRNNRRYCRLPF